MAILRALGCRSSQILILFLSRSLLVGLIGAVVGCACGLAGALLLRGEWTVPLLGEGGMLPWPLVIGGPVIGTALGVVAGWIPALFAAQQDPAAILKDA